MKKFTLNHARFFFFNGIVLVLTFLLMALAPFAHPKVLSAELRSSSPNQADAINQQLTISFSRPMDQDSVIKNFSISPAVDGNVSWSNNTLFFTPKLSFQYGQKYTATISIDAADIYHRHLTTNFHYQFQTKPYQFVYINDQNQLVLGDLQGHNQQISYGKIIKDYQVNSQKHEVVYLSQPDENAATETYLYDLNTQHTIHLFPDFAANISNLKMTGDGTTLYFIATVKSEKTVMDQNGDPTNMVNKVFQYDILTKKLSESDLMTAYPTLVRFWITPDGNTFMINDINGELFLRAISGGKSVALGKYADYRGGSARGDTLVFLDNSPDTGYLQGIVLYNGATKRVTNITEIAASPFLSRDGKLLSYSYIPSTAGGSAGQEGVKVISLPDQKVIFQKIDPAFSYELSKISPDSRYLAIEVYTKEQLLDFTHVRTYGEPNKPDKAIIVFYDLTNGTKAQAIDGKELRWVE